MSTMYDVVLIGGGPVGLTMGIHLAQFGHRVLIMEATDLKRCNPRALALNGESQRLLVQKIGLGDNWKKNTMPASMCTGPLGRLHLVTTFPNPQSIDSDVKNDNPLSAVPKFVQGQSGHSDVTFFQPELMRQLRSRITQIPNLELRLETRFIDFVEETNSLGCRVIRVVFRPVQTEWTPIEGGEWVAKDVLDGENGDVQHSIWCKYLVGCDGVHSLVRQNMIDRTSAPELDRRALEAEKCFNVAIEEQGAGAHGIAACRRGSRMSLNYTDTRICVDVELLREEIIGTKLAPYFVQTCDAKMPATIIPGAWVSTDGYVGGRHWRFEILSMDDKVDLNKILRDENKCYELISPFVTREDVRIIRTAVYHPTAGQSLIWRLNHCFLAGDSAHNTPPWMGQGLNQGFNDVWNLTWKLDLCIRGLATDRLLDSYEQERQPNNTRQLVAACRCGALVQHFSQLFAESGDNVEHFKSRFHAVIHEVQKHPLALFTQRLDGPMMRLPEHLGQILRQPMQVEDVRAGSTLRSIPLDALLGNGLALLSVGDFEPTVLTLDKLHKLQALHYRVPLQVVSQLGNLFAGSVVAALVRPDHVVCGTAANAAEAESLVAAFDNLFGPMQTLQHQNKALIVGTGAAYGNHYTTEEMKTFFKSQRAIVGDVQFDGAFADRVLDACGFEGHSVCLPPGDVFRTMTRSEYLKHRMSSLLDMATRAAEEALKSWGGNREDITHLYWGTMTGAMQSPTLDIHLTKRLRLNNDVARTSMEGMGCLTGYRLLNLARETALSNPNARILCLEGDLRSAIGNSLPPKASKVDIVSAALFRDASSAAVVSGSGVNASERVYYEMVCGLSRIVPDTEHYVDYRECDCGSIRLHLDKELPQAVGRAEPDFAKTLISKARVLGHSCPDMTEMDIACHTGGPRVLEEVRKACGVEEEALHSSWEVMLAHGNLSGASNMAVLDHHNRCCGHGESANKWVFCLSMGPGICLEGLLLRRISSVKRTRSTMRRKSSAEEMCIAWDKIDASLPRHGGGDVRT